MKANKKKIAPEEKSEFPPIKTIDPIILKACKNSGVKSIRQMNFIDEYIKNPNATQAYKKSYSNNYKSAIAVRMNASHLLEKQHIKDSIEQILTSNDITKQTTIQFHKNLRDNTKKDTIKLETNRDFLKILNILDNRQTPQVQNNYILQDNQIDIKNIDKLLALDKPLKE